MKRLYIKRIAAMVIAVSAFCSLGIKERIAYASRFTGMTPSVSESTKPNESGYVFRNVTINGGGYVPSVIFNASERGLAYLRTDMGGAYRLDTETNRWIQLMDWVGPEDWNMLGCESIATDPIDPDRVYIVAGTYTNDWTMDNGYLLRSTNKGDTFERIELPFKAGGNMPGRNMGERLNIDPNDNSVLYLGARSGKGLWRSTDYGSTWNKVETFTEAGSYVEEYMNDAIGVLWTIFDSSSSEKGEPCKDIYVGVANKDKENTIFHSKDGGETWSPVEGQPTYNWEPTEEAPGNYFPGRAAMGSDGMLYISYVNQTGPYNGNKGGVWKYNTKTGEWTDISPEKDINAAYWGYGGITVDAVNPNIIMTSRLNSWYPDTNIYRSTDGGETWNQFWNYNWSGKRVNEYRLNYSNVPWLDWSKTKEEPETSPVLGWMVGDIKIDPFDSNHVVYGTGATLFGIKNMTNLDRGQKFDIKPEIEGVEEVAVLDLITPPSGPAQLISGLADIGGFVHLDINKAPKMIKDPTLDNASGLDYAELNPEIIVRCGDEAIVALSKDGGKTWMKTEGKIEFIDDGGNFQEVGGNICISADGKTIVYSTKGHGATVLYSNNDGEEWTASQGVPAGAKVISDRVNPKKFYAVAEGKFYASIDGGKTFEETGVDVSGMKDVSAVPGQEGHIWLCAQENGMLRSTDGGKTFTKLDNIQDAQVVGFGKAAEGSDYMSIYTNSTIYGVAGMYRSDDAGASWIRVNDDAHQYGMANTAITGDPNVFGRFYIGANGRGIIMGELAAE